MISPLHLSIFHPQISSALTCTSSSW